MSEPVRLTRWNVEIAMCDGCNRDVVKVSDPDGSFFYADCYGPFAHRQDHECTMRAVEGGLFAAMRT